MVQGLAAKGPAQDEVWVEAVVWAKAEV